MVNKRSRIEVEPALEERLSGLSQREPAQDKGMSLASEIDSSPSSGDTGSGTENLIGNTDVASGGKRVLRIELSGGPRVQTT